MPECPANKSMCGSVCEFLDSNQIGVQPQEWRSKDAFPP